ncbi:MAG: hypothetical protein WBX01_13010, partial [Nitrososphaeraceae archaeon]
MFSVSKHTAKYPIPGTGVFFITTLPPNCSTLEECSSSNVTIISYYDSIQNFSYSSTDGVLTWYMPFDWDINRLEKDQNIQVHNE